MGYGLPAALGAKVGRPECLVVDIDGDASFNMTLTELSTAAQFGIGVKILILNNEEQGMVTQVCDPTFLEFHCMLMSFSGNPCSTRIDSPTHIRRIPIS